MKNTVNVRLHKSEASVAQPSSAAPFTASPLAPDSSPPESEARFDAQYLERKQRAKRLLDQLDENQFATLSEWLLDENLTLSQILELVAAPPPNGFGIKTHITTIQRLRVTQRSAKALCRIQDALESTTDLSQSADLSRIEEMQSAISNLLHARAFHLATESPGSEVLTRILTGIQKLSALEHKRQLLVLAREKLHAASHSAHSPRRHHVNLTINPNPNLNPDPNPTLPTPAPPCQNGSTFPPAPATFPNLTAEQRGALPPHRPGVPHEKAPDVRP